MQFSEPIILSIGGGKGGVGKSMTSANFAVYCASQGLKTILLDLDFGAANLHTIFGIAEPKQGLGEFLTTPRSLLKDYLQETDIPNLTLGCSGGFIPDLANLKYMQKTKIIKQIKNTEADVILLDLGAGSSYNVIDFFAATQTGLVISTPEPTATINAYEFLKNVLYRILFRFFKKQDEILDIIKSSSLSNNPYHIHNIHQLISTLEKEHPFAAETISGICEDLNFYIIFNQAHEPKEAMLGEKLCNLSLKHLNIPLNYPGIVYYNQEVNHSVINMRPILASNPDSITSKTLKRIFSKVLKSVIKKKILGKKSEDFASQMSTVLSWAQADFEENLIKQKQIERTFKENHNLNL
jgi:flagellar biosynthesis protein FlhG